MTRSSAAGFPRPCCRMSAPSMRTISTPPIINHFTGRARKYDEPQLGSPLACDPKAWCLGRLSCTLHVGLDLGLVDGPDLLEGGDRMIAPIHPQVHDRPSDLAHDIKSR